MVFIFKHFWIPFIIFTFINAFVLKARSKKYINENPELENGYNTFFKGILTYGNIPWIIMGIGDLCGLTNSIFDFFHPRALNPVVLVFHAAVVILWALSIRWIYFREGAEFLERHPGLIQKRGFSGNLDNVTAKQVKLFYALALLGGSAGMISMWFSNMPEFPIK